MKMNQVSTVIHALVLIVTSALLAPVQANTADTIQDRYERAKALTEGLKSGKLASNSLLYPVWIGQTNHFWYERRDGSKRSFHLVDADAGTNELAFDHKALAQALSKATGEIVTADQLPVNNRSITATTNTVMTLDPVIVRFTAYGKRWEFNDKTRSLKEIEAPEINHLLSPDRTMVVFKRDYNLWVRDVRTGKERALTSDGEEFFQYAIPGSIYGNSAFVNCIPPQAVWSPDSKRLFTVQLDQRQVESLGVIDHVPLDGSLRPQTRFRKIAFPEDEHVEEYRLVVIDVESGVVQPASYGRLPTIYGGAGGYFENNLGWWGKDSRLAYFVDVDRYHKRARVVEFNTDTGATRILFEDKTDTHVELTMDPFNFVQIMPLPETDELLWYSDRSGWSHYYLYDLKTGKLKNRVTEGQWVVRDMLHFDPDRRELFLQTAGRVNDRDPYYRDLVRVNIDTGAMTTLVTGDYEHNVYSPKSIMQLISLYHGSATGVSPTGEYVVVTRSRTDQLPVSWLLDREGNKVLDLEKTVNLPQNWQWPQPVKMKAADGKTDIYGAIYRPGNFSSDKKYPVIDQSFISYPLNITAKGSFNNDTVNGSFYAEAASLAELGFIVVQIDGRGTRYRSKAFRDHSYGWRHKISDIDDHVAGLKQLGARYPYMDMDRVGIVGLNMGGGGALEGLLKYPDFYKVGAAGQIYDSRVMGTQAGDFHEGAYPNKDGKYHEQLVTNLKGKLLLMVGLQDYVPPAVTFRIVEALQRANKDFDLIVEPNAGYAVTPYQRRRAWDYMVKHLQGVEPPREFNLEPKK